MSYSKRITTLCSLLKKTDIFADVGCDHGYCSEYMLKNNFCNKVILSDISKESLKKAEILLNKYILEGRAVSVLGNGFYGVPNNVGEVIIAGMGGKEIYEILTDNKYGFLPNNFLFQPMHDSEILRRFIINNGGYIEKDFTFKAGKYYDVIQGRKLKYREQVQSYSDIEYKFGRDNLKNKTDEFIGRLKKKRTELLDYLKSPKLQEDSRCALVKRLKEIEAVLDENY